VIVRASATPTPKNDDLGGEAVYEKSIGGVLQIETENGESGSGFLIGPHGYGITAAHVVIKNGAAAAGGRAKILGSWVPFRVIHVFTNNDFCSVDDIALIKLASPVPGAHPLPIADSSTVKVGAQVFIIGNSLGGGTCFVTGIISDTNRKGRFMTDANVNPGNSGGPVLNKKAEVISVHVGGAMADAAAGIRAAGMKYDIPINYVKNLIKDFEKRSIHVVF
jgi:serine protease Do